MHKYINTQIHEYNKHNTCNEYINTRMRRYIDSINTTHTINTIDTINTINT